MKYHTKTTTIKQNNPALAGMIIIFRTIFEGEFIETEDIFTMTILQK